MENSQIGFNICAIGMSCIIAILIFFANTITLDSISILNNIHSKLTLDQLFQISKINSSATQSQEPLLIIIGIIALLIVVYLYLRFIKFSNCLQAHLLQFSIDEVKKEIENRQSVDIS